MRALVVVTGRDAGRGTEVVGRIRERGGRAEFVKADLAIGEAVRLLADDALAAADGRIDILVDNAAHILPAHSSLEATEDQIDATLGVNVKAPFLLTAALAPGMVDRGAGAVVNIGSVSGVHGKESTAL